MRRFVYEYVKDFNGKQAVLRLGWNATSNTASVQAAKWLNEPYVQYYLQEFIRKADEKAIIERNEVLFGLKREANNFTPYDGSSASRVAALSSLAKILGMQITKVEGTMTHRGGVIPIPVVGSLDDWEKQSKKAQAKLKTEVRK